MDDNMTPNEQDYESKYHKLYKEVQEANAYKQRHLNTIYDEVAELLGHICEPDPPGCGGADPTGTLEEFAQACRESNTEKQNRLTTIYDHIEELRQKICDPDPPGCLPESEAV